MDEIQKTLLMQVADLHEVPTGAYNIRSNGASAGRHSTEHIEIVPKEDKPGIDIFIKTGTKKESVHIPVLMTQTGLKELVYNDFILVRTVMSQLWRDAVFTTVETKQANTAGFILFLSAKIPE